MNGRHVMSWCRCTYNTVEQALVRFDLTISATPPT